MTALLKFFALIAATLCPALASAAPIVRHANPPPALILGGVTIPPGAELVLLSGQVASPINPAKTATMDDFGDTRTQTISTFSKMKAALAKLGYSMSDVVKLTAFVAGDPKMGRKMDFAGFNAAYKEFFGTSENPNLVARSTVQVQASPAPIALLKLRQSQRKRPR